MMHCDTCGQKPDEYTFCPDCGDKLREYPWYVDPDKMNDMDVSWPHHSSKTVYEYKPIYHSTPYHKEYHYIPDVVEFTVWPPNTRLAVENLSLIVQSVLGPPGLEHHAVSELLHYLGTFGNNDEELAAVAIAYDHILASNGGCRGTLTLAVPDTGFSFPDPAHPVYFKFEKGRMARLDWDVPRYNSRLEEKDYVMDIELLQAARRIQEAVRNPPVEIELSAQSYSLSHGDLGLGIDIRDEVTIR